MSLPQLTPNFVLVTSPLVSATAPTTTQSLSIHSSHGLQISPDSIDPPFMGKPQDTPTLTMRFLGTMRDFINDPVIMETFRMTPKAFTRKRVLTFPRTVSLICFEHTKALQTRLDEFYGKGGFDADYSAPTACAFFLARAKLNPLLFSTWTHEVGRFFYDNYESAGLVRRWHGHLILAVDGTELRIPDTPKTRKTCTVLVSPQNPNGTVMAGASLLHDVLNQIPLHCALSGKKPELAFWFEDHLKYCPPDAVVVFDRLYTNYSVIAICAGAGIHFVIRAKTASTFRQVEQFAQSDQTDVVITLEVTESQKQTVRAHQWPTSVQVRLVKVALPTGETEVLMTSLLDPVRYPAAEFQWLYHQRWGVETAFYHFKDHLETERFSSGKPQYIAQDVYAMAFLLAFEAVLDKEADLNLQRESQKKGLKYTYHIKRKGAYSAIMALLPQLLVIPKVSTTTVLEQLRAALVHQQSPIRPERTSKRRELSTTQRLNAQLYKKKGC
jgi:hypothetical protein